MRRRRIALAVSIFVADERARRACRCGDRGVRDDGRRRRRWKIAAAVAFKITDQGAGANGDGVVVGVGALADTFVFGVAD